MEVSPAMGDPATIPPVPPADPAGEITDAEVVDPTPGREIATVPPPAAGVAVMPQVTAADLVARLSVIREASRDAMQDGVDYGKVPGTDKPTLLKPGAEKLGVLFQLDIQLDNEKTWGPGDHLTVTSHATVYHAPTGARLGYGEGICTTREKKYAYRKAERECPSCGKANIRRSRNEAEGWYCWRKTDGCGATFPPDDERITSQQAGQVDNPDLPDAWNTVVKMAEKRARVDAVLAVTGASALFTQDVEDTHDAPPVETAAAAGAAVPVIEGDDIKQLGQLIADLIGVEDGPVAPEEAERRRGIARDTWKQLAAITSTGRPTVNTLQVVRSLNAAFHRIREDADTSDIPWSPDYSQEPLS
jgi:ribosomal protein L37AE/L43A